MPQQRSYNPALAIALLVLAIAAAWLIWVAHLVPVRDYPLVGGLFLALGLFSSVMWRVIGSNYWKKGVRSPKLFSPFWIKLGERGAQICSLGLGVIFVGVGVFLLGDSAFNWLSGSPRLTVH